MFNYKKALFLLLPLIILFSYVTYQKNQKRKIVELEIGSMVRKMIMVGFRDEDLDYVLKKNKAGGYILFGQDYLTQKDRNLYNIQNAKNIISKLKDKNIELIAVDNEGGPVNRLNKIEDFGNMESVIEMSKLSRPDRIYQYKYYCKKMADLGITVDFAPVVDLQINKDSNFFMNIRQRLFSDKPREVSDLAIDFIESAKENHLITSLKHFPGHGSASSDTHLGFVDVTKTWNPIELDPYKILIQNRNLSLTTIMIAHVYNKNIDDKYPMSMSSIAINKYLRKLLNFKGVVVSDAIDMKALSSNFSLEEILINSVNAGVNIIVHANQITYDKNIAEKMYDIIIKSVISGKIKKEKIIESGALIDELIKKRKESF